jgi:4-hydroxythreonine-4-phosphate dehydrogenase
VQALADYTLIGSMEALGEWGKRLSMPAGFPLTIPNAGVLDVTGESKARRARAVNIKVTPGTPTRISGMIAARAIDVAARTCMEGSADALVTSPIAKEALRKAGIPFNGHTDMLQFIAQSRTVTMILLSPRMRVALATVHVQLKRAPSMLTKKLILGKLRDLNHTLRIDFALQNPRIAVLGVNPHAGERGMFGDEEKKIVAPAIRAAQKEGVLAEGPFPADGFFARWTPMKYDAILAMYHDQGLIPLKMDAQNEGVNFSANLPFVRTSPDHGTAFDIAGKNIAKEESFIEAIKVALQIARNRNLAYGHIQ